MEKEGKTKCTLQTTKMHWLKNGIHYRVKFEAYMTSESLKYGLKIDFYLANCFMYRGDNRAKVFEAVTTNNVKVRHLFFKGTQLKIEIHC